MQCRGVILKILDATFTGDAIHRGMGQIMPTARRVMFASMYTAKPAFMQPMYMADITVPTASVSDVVSTVSMRHGEVVENHPKAGRPITQLRAYLPVSHSFGFSKELQVISSGKSFSQCIFDHWACMVGDPLTPGNRVYELVSSIRRRKGLEPVVPPLDRYLDKL